MKKGVLGIVALVIWSISALRLQAQSNIPILTWQSHFSYNSIVDIADAGSRLYAAAPNALFFVDLQEGSVSKLTKNDGLSDISIGAIGYSTEQATLVVGYTNGNIDLVRENSITNIRAFLEATLIGGRRVYDVSFNANLVYLSTDQGILVVDLDQDQIVESYQNLDDNGERLTVFATTFTADSLYAATPRGILSASLNSGVNRQDFNNWERTLTNQAFTKVVRDGTALIAATGNQLYRFSANQWQPWQTLSAPVNDLFIASGTVHALTPDQLFSVTASTLTPLLNLEQAEGTASALAVVQNNFWIGDGINGLNRFDNGNSTPFSPAGPASDNAWYFTRSNGEVQMVHGGFSDQVTTLGRTGAVSRFTFQFGWSSQNLQISDTDAIFDLVDLEVATEAGEPLFLASFDRGLIAFDNLTEEVSVINEISSTSTLESVNGSINMTALARQGDLLWMTNYGAGSTLHSWNLVTDEWTAYNLNLGQASFPIGLYIAPNGNKWLPIDPSRGGGIVVFNEESGAERYLNTNGGQGGLPGRHVTSLVLDDDFFLWVGTDEGISFFPNTGVVLDGNSLSASAPIFENRLLLRDEFITSIVVDPGNRKWFGTQNNGLWLFSETGEELIFHFTADNSPLPSDQITSLFLERQSGELFIGTNKGTVSFRSDATEGTARHENVTIFPNPASRNSVEQIVINGLAENALLKITDASGKLVREVRAQGSTALWNARDINGQVVSTGVYLVFSTNRDGTETFVGKIAVI